MALTITKVADGQRVEGNKRKIDWDITYDSSYVTGGEPVTAAQLGLRRVESLTPHGPFRNTAGTASITVSFDRTNLKLLAYNVGAHTHTENTAAAYTQNATTAASTAASQAEVANATDLSTFSGRVTVSGY